LTGLEKVVTAEYLTLTNRASCT